MFAKNVDERGRNFMCERTILSPLVAFAISELEKFANLITIWDIKIKFLYGVQKILQILIAWKLQFLKNLMNFG